MVLLRDAFITLLARKYGVSQIDGLLDLQLGDDCHKQIKKITIS